jgi:hypothetical protein
MRSRQARFGGDQLPTRCECVYAICYTSPMPTNPYQSPEERGASVSRSRHRSWWKIACLFGLAAILCGAVGVVCFFEDGLGMVFMSQHTHPKGWETRASLFVLSFCTFWIGAIAFLVGLTGWTVAWLRRN